MKKVKLGNIASVITKGTTPTTLGYNFADGGVNFVKIESIAENGEFLTDKFAHITEECDRKLSRSQLQKNDLLFSIAGAIGRTAIVTEDILPANTNQALAIIRVPEGVVDYSYLKYVLQSPDIVEQFEKKKQGVAQLNISLKDIGDFEIPLCTAKEQKSVVATMDKVSELIALRKEQLAKLDQLVKSRFIELFGNFVYDRDRWQICVVGDVADTIDPQPSHRTPPISTDGVPYIGIAECNYRTRLIEFEKARKVGQNVLREHIDRYTLDKGDFIIGKIGTIGKPFFIPAEQTYTLSANTVLIKPNKNKVDPQYLFAVFQSEYMDRIIDAEKKSTSQPAFGIQKVRRIEIPMPPIELQEQFSTFVEQTDKSKFAIQQSLDKLELLKKSLMQEYFG